MNENKEIKRDGQSATKIFDNRSLKVDYRTLEPLLQKGMKILDVGCGTGSMSKDMARIIGDNGHVTGIDNTKRFVESGKESYKDISNLSLVHSDLFEFETSERFDLITSARMLQWLKNPKAALKKMKSLLKPDGMISILDYNHNKLEWDPEPPQSMQEFYSTFLRWRRDAGMNNGMADDVSALMKEIGLTDIKEINSDELYLRERADFHSKVGIWSQVAGSTQMVEEGYLDNDLRLKAIEEYDNWVENEAISMTMKLKEVRGKALASKGPNEMAEELLLLVKLEQDCSEIQRNLKIMSLDTLNSELTDDVKKKAFWINIYNAFYQIIRKEGVVKKSHVYTSRCIDLVGNTFSLDDIEHGILRKNKFKYSLGYFSNVFIPRTVKDLMVNELDYRIHFALNCGAKSCPPIAFYKVENLNHHLDLATRSFLDSETEYLPEKGIVWVSTLFKWFYADFGGNKGIVEIYRKQLGKDISSLKLKYKKYSWEDQLMNFTELS